MSFTKNIKTDYGALGNGQVALTNVSITSGTNTLAVSSLIFAIGDIGKAINIIGADAADATLKTTISGFVDSQHVTLAVTASTTLTASSQRLYWGTDDSTAFTNWGIDARAQGTTPCILTIPAGIYCNFSSSHFWIGVFDLTINMDGATLSEFSTGGALPQAAVGVSSARLNQVNSGDSVLSLVVPAQTSIFTVGTWVCLSSLEMQGFGYPPNWAFHEYHKITAIGVGTITIDVPATFKHLTTYPVSNPGYDMGGPATLFIMDSTWDQTVVVNGGVGGGVLDCDGQVQLLARSITITNCNIGQQNGVDPTISQAITLTDCTLHNVEVDKDVTSFTLNNCTCALIVYQSASITNSYINGGTYTTFSGTGRNMAMSGVTVTSIFRLGCLNYGATLSISADNCSFASIDWNAQPLLLSSTLTFSSGVFRGTGVASLDLLARGIPGTVIFWYATSNLTNGGHQATVTALWTDGVANYMSITPSLTSPPKYAPDPDETPLAITTTGIEAHPAPSVTFRTCTGCADALDLSQAPAGAPLYSYSKRTYASDAIGTNPLTTQTFVWGKVAWIKVNVTAAASGVGPLNVTGSAGTAYLDSANFMHQADLNYTIDLTQVGLRVITPTGVTGALGADNLTPNPAEVLPSPKWLWMVAGINPFVGTVITGGSVTIEVLTIQQSTDLGTVLYSLNSVW